jgi:2',3'-cyclic-nucleotide 2'-phosphodiesterase (5'-nucleotidase family)
MLRSGTPATTAGTAAALALALLFSAQPCHADDYLVSEKHGLYKRQNTQSKNITFLHVNDVHAHLDEYRSSGRPSITFFNLNEQILTLLQVVTVPATRPRSPM